MRLIIHAGFTKTGTKALQDALYSERQRLASHGILYPSRVTDRFSAAHAFLINALMDPSCAHVRIFERELGRALDEVDHPIHTMVLSHEGVLNRVFIHSKPALIELDKVLEGYEVDLFAVRREKDAWITSSYRQSIVNQRNDKAPSFSPAGRFGTAALFDEFRNDAYLNKLAEHERALTHLRSLIKHRSFLAADYEGDWFGAFRSFLGTGVGWLALPSAQKNEAVPHVYLEILRQVNGWRLPLLGVSAWKHAIHRITGTTSVQVCRESHEFEATGESLDAFVNPDTLAQLAYVANPPLRYGRDDFFEAVRQLEALATR